MMILLQIKSTNVMTTELNIYKLTYNKQESYGGNNV